MKIISKELFVTHFTFSLLLFACNFQVNAHTEVQFKEEDYYDDNDNQEVVQEPTTTEMVIKEIRFTYGEDDPFGPLRWRNKKLLDRPPSPVAANKARLSLKLSGNLTTTTTTIFPKIKRLYEGNFCQTNWLSPINIDTRRLRRTEGGRDIGSPKEEEIQEESSESIPETLIVSIAIPNIQYIGWGFGHPMKYHGIEIRPSTLGIIQIKDNFDPVAGTNSFTTYDFHFLSLYYCDLEKALPHRTMHQIDGKRFPLELEFVFLRKVTESLQTASDFDDIDEEEKMSTLYDGKYVAMIVSVLGEVGEENIYFQPVVEAATKFRGKDFQYDNDYERNVLEIKSPWSPTWLLPDSSEYYYYDDGSFPVPPCWSVARYYVMKDRITISQEQLDALTFIRTDREKSTNNTLPCTHSISLVHNDTTLVTGETPVRVNLIEYDVRGHDDGKPRSKAEVGRRAARKRKREMFRRRLAGHAGIGTGRDAAVGEENEELNNGASGSYNNSIEQFVKIMVMLMLHYA